jgi:N-carbamoyl-L-amino-acid hydrolase
LKGIDEDRAIADLRTLADFGRFQTGVDRPAMSEPDLEARHWLRERMAEAGLDAEIDGVGNVYGRSPSRMSVLLGSHSDTVPRGGWLDGALGVIYALETARAHRAVHPNATVGVDAISFSDEEGTFLACAGSRSFCGALKPGDLESARNADGDSVVERLAHHGLSHRGRAALDPARHRAFLEAHIEQGPRLIESGLEIGVVTGIVGLRRRRVRFSGRADHAGTTPMNMRQDAGFAMFSFATAAAERLRAAGSSDSVWNFGVASLKPGAANVVPHEAEVVVEFRDLSSDVMERMDRALLDLIEERKDAAGVAVASTMIGAIEPTTMNERMLGHLDFAARAEGAKSQHMQSGAGHDAMIVGRQIPAGMLFVPSIGGRSHHISENTDEADIRRGLRVYARAVQSILEAFGSDGQGAL